MGRVERVVKLTQDLVRINSENPPGNERNIAKYVLKFLKDFGYQAEIVEFALKRSNVLCFIRAKSPRRRLLISPHLDTVG